MTTRQKLCGTCIALLPLLPCDAWAAHPLSSDDTGTQGSGGVEVELTLGSGKACESPFLLNVAQGVGLHVGITDDLDIGLSNTYQSTRESSDSWSSGLADPVVDIKWKFLPAPEYFPETALRVDYRAPQSSALDNTGHDLGAVLIFSWVNEKRFGHLNIGSYERGLATGHLHNELLLAGSAGTRMTERGWAVAEVFTYTKPKLNESLLAGTLGMLWEWEPGKIGSIGAGPAWAQGHRLGWMLTGALTFTLVSP